MLTFNGIVGIQPCGWEKLDFHRD